MTTLASLSTEIGTSLPALITAEGDAATRRFVEFFTAQIHSRNTRKAYASAVVFLTGTAIRSISIGYPGC